jgi:hypothetical protein
MSGVVGVGPLLQACQDRLCKLLRFYLFSITYPVDIFVIPEDSDQLEKDPSPFGERQG